MGRETGAQGDLMLSWSELPRSPGHAFYDRLQGLLLGGRVRPLLRGSLQALLCPVDGRPSLPPGRYLQMIGYFEGVDSERGISWRCADSHSLRKFLRLSTSDKVPDHSWT